MGRRVNHYLLATALTAVLGGSSTLALPKQDKLQDFDYWASLCCFREKMMIVLAVGLFQPVVTYIHYGVIAKRLRL